MIAIGYWKYVVKWISLDQYLQYFSNFHSGQTQENISLLFDETKLGFANPTKNRMKYFWAIEMLKNWYSMNDLDPPET
jgi:hypothetical protein